MELLLLFAQLPAAKVRIANELRSSKFRVCLGQENLGYYGQWNEKWYQKHTRWWSVYIVFCLAPIFCPYKIDWLDVLVCLCNLIGASNWRIKASNWIGVDASDARESNLINSPLPVCVGLRDAIFIALSAARILGPQSSIRINSSSSSSFGFSLTSQSRLKRRISCLPYQHTTMNGHCE